MLEGCAPFLLLVLAAAGVSLLVLRKTVNELGAAFEEFRSVMTTQLISLNGELLDLRRELEQLRASAEAFAAHPEAPEPAATAAPPFEQPPEPLAPVALPLPERPAAATEPERPAAPDPPVEFPVAAFEAAASAEQSADAEPPRSEAPPPPPSAAPPPPQPPPFALPNFDFESLVGVKLFSWIAGIALALAGVFFLRYSIDHGWVTPPIRMAFGFLTGAGILLFSSFRFGRDYRVTANALDGAAIAILYATTYASHAMWHLIPFTAAFAMMIVVTVVAVLLSLRRDSPFIALLGMLGGFATPAILASPENRPVALFSYLLILNAGLAWTAYRRRWPHVVTISVVFTTLYQVAWVGRFLDRAQLPLGAAVFLAFPILFAVLHLLRSSAADDLSPRFRKAIAFSGMVPLAFAVYTAAVPAIGSRFHVLFAFLLLAVVGFAFVAVRISRDDVSGGLPAVASLVVFAVWLARGWTPAAWPAILGWLALFVVLFAFGPLLLRRFGHDELIDRSTIVAGVLLFALSAIVTLEPATRAPAAVFVTGAALLCVIAASAYRTGRETDYLAGALAIVMAQAFWSVRHLAPETLRSAVLLYGGFALLMLMLAAAGRFVRKSEVAPASPWLLFGTLGLGLFLLGPSVNAIAFAALALLAGFLFAAFAAEAIRTSNALLFALGGAGTLLLLFLWMAITGAPRSATGLLAVVAALAIGALAAAAIAAKRHPSEPGVASGFGTAAHLSLAAELFLLLAVTDPRVVVAPGVIISVLSIVVFANAVGALHLRRVSLHVASIAGAFVVVAGWLIADRDAVIAPLLAACGFAAFAIIWIAAARRVVAREHAGVRIGVPPLAAWTAASIVSLIALQVVAMIATGSPSIDPRVVAAIVIAAPLALAAISAAASWHAVALVGVATSAVSAIVFRGIEFEPTTALAFAVSLAHYAIFTVYGFVTVRRAGTDVAPLLVPVAATVPFFFFARDAMYDWGLRGIIGVLPVALALVLLALLRQTLAAERGREANSARRALVAAAALAFITVAIPLQLEKEWITLGWALEAAALAWLFTRIPHRGLFAASVALFAVVFVRLVFNPAVFSYHPRAATPIVNWYLYTYTVAAAAFYAGAAFLRRATADEPAPAQRNAPTLLSAAGTLLLFLLLNIEIADFYSTGMALTFNFFSASLAQELTYTLGWAVFALALLIAGIARANRGARIAAIALLSLTAFKCFLHDLGTLGGLYRVAAFVGLAISLALVAVLLQKFAIRRPSEGAHP